MKICFIGPANSMHIVKWCDWFSNHGHEIYVVSFVEGEIKNVKVHVIKTKADRCSSDVRKIGYLLHGKKIKRLVDKIRPDIISVHYATSYGTAAALSGIRNYTLSIWGSDIYDFPRKSVLHRWMLQYSLNKAAQLFSTSRVMADEAKKYTKKTIEVTPFGIDMELFSPSKRSRDGAEGEEFIVGTVKALEDHYGISYLLKAAAIVRNKRPGIPIKLRIAGKGSKENEYRQLAQRLKIDDITTWLGFISQEAAAVEWANMDVAVIPSLLESFGVAAVEAQACGVPVIISDIPGLMEAACPGESAVVVPRKNEKELARAIIELYRKPERRKKMGGQGIRYVADHYEIDKCFRKIEELFQKNLL